ncbi:sigma-70 family RNA polymerase sigma factor [Larkinella harenae]
MGSDVWNAVKSGDGEAFNELMQQHYRPLFSYGTKLTFDKELVRDCIQEVFLEIWRRRAEISVAESPRFYLLRALQRKIGREISRNRVLYQSDELEPDASFAVEFSIETDLIIQQEREQNARRLTSLINALTARQKEVVYLRFYQNLSFDEIADFMQLNRQSVYNLMSEALRLLRKKWHGAWAILPTLLWELSLLWE